ncbi:hypothetical protein BOX15_Mlig020915g2 [Macrostomum lignano]|uniref:Ephrin_rec_like domain-containing protein n=2 Tax=Macrostomum lignano TaxID=282301 RepID=A0A1I8FYD8_9PLAT|nr:hypothetical protein BOX15_Mlig020915g2 [Macrostomum lignano]
MVRLRSSASLALLAMFLSIWPSQSLIKQKNWFIPTRLTARIPCLTEELLRPGRTIDQEHSSTSLYRWVQSDGNIIGSGFYQTVRLLRVPANHSDTFHVVQLECMLYDWTTDSTLTSAHKINFYESPTLTSAVTLGFLYRQNFTEFVDYLGQVDFVREWCIRNELCIEAVVAPVRSPELEFPHLFDSATAFDRSPLTDLLTELRSARVTGLAKDFTFYVNFVLRMRMSNRLEDLCDPRMKACWQRLLEGRHSVVLQFSEASVQILDNFAEERATVRKLRMPNQELTDAPVDALNYSLRIYSNSICPAGFAPANLTTLKLTESLGSNGDAVLCLACPPGYYGTNGLNCFKVPNDHYINGWGQVQGTPCPDFFVTDKAGSVSKKNCTYNGTLPEMLVMEAMRLAWTEIEEVFNGGIPGLVALLLLFYLFFSAYALFWQLHRLITLMRYKTRRGMSDRLLKRFIAEAYLRDIRRLQYWKAKIEAAKPNVQRFSLEKEMLNDDENTETETVE